MKWIKKQAIETKTPAEIEKMRAAGRVVREVLNRCKELARPGVTTRMIDEEADRLIRSRGGEGLFKNYPGPTPFPSHLCISVNEVVVHGIASDYAIKEGDIVGVDCGVRLDGWCGDAATTLLVGEVAPATRQLCADTEHCLALAMETIKPGRKWSEVARVMQQFAEGKGYGVVRNFIGHGIGRKLHMDPQVPNFVSRDLLKNDWILKEGMTIAVEPMVNLGTPEVEVLADGWTVITKDHKPSAHYEHTIAVTKTGCEALTDGR